MTKPRKHVTYFPYPHDDQFSDVAAEYEGEVMSENDDWIELMVWGDRMTFSKDRVIISPAAKANA